MFLRSPLTAKVPKWGWEEKYLKMQQWTFLAPASLEMACDASKSCSEHAQKWAELWWCSLRAMLTDLSSDFVFAIDTYWPLKSFVWHDHCWNGPSCILALHVPCITCILTSIFVDPWNPMVTRRIAPSGRWSGCRCHRHRPRASVGMRSDCVTGRSSKGGALGDHTS